MKVLACGVFDLLHAGHVAHLEEARAMGSSLTVALTVDELVGKGTGRPVCPFVERLAMLRALRCVDAVLISDAPRPDALIKMLRPAIYCKGVDYTGQVLPEQALVESLGGRVVYTNTPKWSSTQLMEALCAS